MEGGKLRCKELLIGEFLVSCVFEICHRDEEWVFTSVYCRGVSSEREMLWKT